MLLFIILIENYSHVVELIKFEPVTRVHGNEKIHQSAQLILIPSAVDYRDINHILPYLPLAI